MALYMESTTIDESKTIGEITAALVGAGARAINTEYGPDRRIIAVRFVLNVNGCDAVFHLPAKTEPIFLLLQKQRAPMNRSRKEKEDRAQSGRVAWRQILRWVQAQLALIETGMVEPAEPFSPYMVDNTGRTLYERVIETQFPKALPPAERS
jgi:hypothetical protein